MTGEEVSNSATSHTEKRTSSQSVEEPADQHRLSILGHSTWNQPYQEDGERDYVDISASVELVKPSVIDSDLSRREGRIDGIDVLRTEEQGIVDRFLPRRSHHQLLCDEPQHLKPLTETPNECRQAQRRNFSAHSEFFCQLIICGRIHGRRACPTTISLVWYQTSSAVRRRQGATSSPRHSHAKRPHRNNKHNHPASELVHIARIHRILVIPCNCKPTSFALFLLFIRKTLLFTPAFLSFLLSLTPMGTIPIAQRPAALEGS